MNDPVTHATLVKRGAIWLRNAGRCSVVITEIATSGEEPDAIGWRGNTTYLVEAKASRADFLADGKKYFRQRPEMGIGAYRYYIAPKGMISAGELPANWGLLEFDGKSVWQSVVAYPQSRCAIHESEILVSTLRRIGKNAPDGVSISCYTFATKNRATLGVEVEAEAFEEEKEATA